MFTDLDGSTATWAAGTREQVDVIVPAAGYQPDFGYLEALGALGADGRLLQREGLSTTHAHLGYVRVEWQRILASATLRGLGRDARVVVSKLWR